MTDQPAWDVAIIDGRPEVVVNLAALRVLMHASPYGYAEARARLIARGVPAELLDGDGEDRP